MYINEHAYQEINIMRSRTQATNTLTTTNYANVAYDPLTYNMASATLATDSKYVFAISCI